MIEKATSMELDRRTEQVFDFLVDFTNEPTWNPECVEVEKTSPGPIGTGSTYRGRMRGVGEVSIVSPLVSWRGAPSPLVGTAQMWRRSMSFAFVV